MARKKKIVDVPIRSTADLVDLISHNTDVTVRALTKLSKKSRRLGIISAFAIVFALCTASECRKQDDEIYKLSIRLKKMEDVFTLQSSEEYPTSDREIYDYMNKYDLRPSEAADILNIPLERVHRAIDNSSRSKGE